MKRVLLSIALALGLVGANGLKAAVDARILILGPEQKQFGVLVLGDSNLSFTVRFIDVEGRVLHTESDVLTNYSKRFDLRNLPKGQYKLEVDYNAQVKIFSIEVLQSAIDIENNNSNLVIKPKLSVKNRRIKLQMSDLDLPVQVHIFDRRGQMIYGKRYSDVENINAIYDFRRLGRGSYRVSVSTLNHTFSETMTIE